MARLTRLQELKIHAKAAGLSVHTWSPGDGVTRYRFFDRVRCQSCLDVPGKDGLGRPCKNCGGSGYLHDDRQTYFGPANGRYTALGLKEAWAFVSGAKVNA